MGSYVHGTLIKDERFFASVDRLHVYNKAA